MEIENYFDIVSKCNYISQCNHTWEILESYKMWTSTLTTTDPTIPDNATVTQKRRCLLCGYTEWVNSADDKTETKDIEE